LKAKSISDYLSAIDSEEIDVEVEIQNEIKNIEEYNKYLNAFISKFEIQTALEISKVSPRTKNSSDLPLFGIPLTIKDNIFLAGQKTTAGSAIFQDFVPLVNADVVDVALASGCVPLGKTNMHELAMGATSSSSFFGPVRNPVDSSRISGGSSGGSAVSVAMAKLPIVSLGTDTGGSVRIPAALCGIYGFKPTTGILSLTGVFPLSATLDHVGILTKNMSDMRVAFDSLTSIDDRVQGISDSQSSAVSTKVGIPGKYFFEDCEEEVEKAFWKTIDSMRQVGFEVIEDLEIQGIEKISRTRRTIQVTEAYWFYQDLVKEEDKRKLVGKDVMSFFEMGSKTGMMEYMVSANERTSIISSVANALNKVDFIAIPTCLTTAPKIEDILGREADGIRRQLVRNTEPFNLCGFPSLTIPSSRPDSSKLPTGIEISGRPLEDSWLLETGERISRLLHHSTDGFEDETTSGSERSS